jgi:HSP20 family protein
LLQLEVNQLFERLMLLEHSERRAAGEWMPSVDVYESSGKLVIVVEVPGLAPEALRVVYSGQQVVISGERRSRRPGRGAAFLCVERPHGHFNRAVPIDTAVDASRAEARLAGGLLTISLPRLKDRRGQDTVVPVTREEP